MVDCKGCYRGDDYGDWHKLVEEELLKEEEYEMHECDSGALKHQEGKLRVDLVPPEAIKALARVLTYGAKKYSDRNWEKGIPYMTHYGSALRHLLMWVEGVDVDEESGELHIEQALSNLAMIATQTARDRDDLDDRGE